MPIRKEANMKWIAGIAALGVVAVIAIGTARGADKVTVGRRWREAERTSIDAVDHRAWDALLAKFVDTQGMVNYRGWKSSSTDQQALDAYLATLSRADTSQPAQRSAQLAFWINAYNAMTIRGILREYPTSSIRNHTPKLIGYNIWDDLLLIVGDSEHSLNQIEHEILRRMDEPRIHFAIVCAARGCPRLLNRAYTSEQLEAQLSAGATHFFAQPAKFTYDAASSRIGVSMILKWFATDFGANTAEQLRSVAPYLPSDEARALAEGGQARLFYLSYDWDLNDQTPPQSARR